MSEPSPPETRHLDHCTVFSNMDAAFPSGMFRYGGTRWRSWLRHCATSRKVAGLIPDGVIGFFPLT